MSSEITQWVNAAITRLNLDAFELPETAAIKVEGQAARKFVSGTPRAWWMALKLPAESFSSKDRKLSSCLPMNAARCWLIAETEKAHLPVFDVRINDLEALLTACPYFEYNAVGQDYSWLIAESDSNTFYICREANRECGQE